MRNIGTCSRGPNLSDAERIAALEDGLRQAGERICRALYTRYDCLCMNYGETARTFEADKTKKD